MFTVPQCKSTFTKNFLHFYPALCISIVRFSFLLLHIVHTQLRTNITYKYTRGERGKSKSAWVSRYLQACFCFRTNCRHYRFDKPSSFRKRVKCPDVFGTVRSAQGYVEDEIKREKRGGGGVGEKERKKRRPAWSVARAYIRAPTRSHAYRDTLYRGPWLSVSPLLFT